MAIDDFVRGNTVLFEIALTDDNDKIIDLTGAVIYFTMKANKSDADPGALQVKVTTHTNPTLGLSEVVLLPTTSENVTPALYFYSFRAILANGEVGTFDSGKVRLKWDITDAIS